MGEWEETNRQPADDDDKNGDYGSGLSPSIHTSFTTHLITSNSSSSHHHPLLFTHASPIHDYGCSPWYRKGKKLG